MSSNDRACIRIGFHRRSRDAFILACVAFVALAPCAESQETASGLPAATAVAPVLQRPSSVRGLVRDSADVPIPYATVVWGEARQVITTSDSGAFNLTDIPSGKTRFTVRRIGYVPVDFDLILKPGTLKPVVVHLSPAAPALTTVDVEAHAAMGADPYRDDRFRATGFFDRKAHLSGYFISPDEVEQRRPTYVSDLMYGVPGVMLVGRPHTPAAHYVASNGRCRLQVYLDGHPVPDGDDFVAGSDVKAVEVYNSLLRPADKFLPSPQKGYCGSIVVWTK